MTKFLPKIPLDFSRGHQRPAQEFDVRLRQTLMLPDRQKFRQLRPERQRPLAAQHIVQLIPLRFVHLQPLRQPGAFHQPGHALAHQRPAQAGKGGLAHVVYAQIGQYPADVAQKQRVGGQNQHLLGQHRFLQLIQQPCHPVQGDGGFAAARYALYAQGRKGVETDHRILLRLNGGDDLPQSGGGHLAQRVGQVFFLPGQPGVLHVFQLPVGDGEHALQAQFAFDPAVRGLVADPADLARIVQVGDRASPVRDPNLIGGRFQHAPAAQIDGTFFSGLQVAQHRCIGVRHEIQPGEIGLTAAQTQLVQAAQLVSDDELLHLRVGTAVVQHLDQPVVAVHDAQIVFQFLPLAADDLQGVGKMLFFVCPFPGGKSGCFHEEMYLRIFNRMQCSGFMGVSRPRPAGRDSRGKKGAGGAQRKKEMQIFAGPTEKARLSYPEEKRFLLRQTCGDAEVFSFDHTKGKIV